MRLPNTITVEQVADELGWSQTKTKAFVRANNIPYHAQAKTYYLDENVLVSIRRILMTSLGDKKAKTRDDTRIGRYKKGAEERLKASAAERIKKQKEKLQRQLEELNKAEEEANKAKETKS